MFSKITKILMLSASLLVAGRSRRDYAFGGYLAGLTACWGCLCLMDRGSELGKALSAMTTVIVTTVSHHGNTASIGTIADINRRCTTSRCGRTTDSVATPHHHRTTTVMIAMSDIAGKRC